MGCEQVRKVETAQLAPTSWVTAQVPLSCQLTCVAFFLLECGAGLDDECKHSFRDALSSNIDASRRTCILQSSFPITETHIHVSGMCNVGFVVVNAMNEILDDGTTVSMLFWRRRVKPDVFFASEALCMLLPWGCKTAEARPIRVAKVGSEMTCLNALSTEFH